MWRNLSHCFRNQFTQVTVVWPDYQYFTILWLTDLCNKYLNSHIFVFIKDLFIICLLFLQYYIFKRFKSVPISLKYTLKINFIKNHSCVLVPNGRNIQEIFVIFPDLYFRNGLKLKFEILLRYFNYPSGTDLGTGYAGSSL